MFDLPVPVPYPLWPTTDRHIQTTDMESAQSIPPVMENKPPPEDVQPPPYPGTSDAYSPDFIDPFELQEIIIERPGPQPERLNHAEVVSKVPSPLQTDATLQQLTAKGDDLTCKHPTHQVQGGTACPGISIGKPATLTPENHTTDSIKSLVTVAADTHKPAPIHQTESNTARDQPTEFPFDSAQSVRPPETTIAANSTQIRRPKDLSVEVKINGKRTRCLVDTGAGVSILDAKHCVDLYDGRPPPL